jgi:hypothetical protein
MVQVWLDIVYLDDAEFKRQVDARKPGTLASVSAK